MLKNTKSFVQLKSDKPAGCPATTISKGVQRLMSVPNEEVVNIIKKLNEKNKHTAKSFLTWLLEEQLDNEDNELTHEDIQAIKQARKEMENGETFSLEEIKRELEI